MNSVLVVRGGASASGEVCAPRLIGGRSDGAFTIMAGQRGAQGRQGAPGPDGGSTLQRFAGNQTISALHLVYELDGAVYPLSFTDGEHIALALGVSLTAADPFEVLNVQRSGAIDEPSWSWTPGFIWLGASGALTQVPPTSGFGLLVGAAVSATRLILNLQQPIEL